MARSETPVWLILCVAVVGGCGSDGPPLADGAGASDAGAERWIEDGHTAICHTTLEDFGTICPASLPSGVELCPCGSDLLVWAQQQGYSSKRCYYDRATGLLVGGHATNDCNCFCDSQAFELEAGKVRRECVRWGSSGVQCAVDGGAGDV